MNERIKQLRSMMNLSQEEFGKLLGISKSGVSDIEAGRRKVTEQHIIMLKMHNVSENWIRTGAGNPIVKTPSSIIEQLRREFDLTDLDCSLISEYLNLNSHDRAVIRDFIHRVNASFDRDIMTQEAIDREVENYRRELEAEAKGEKSSAFAEVNAKEKRA